MADPTVPRPSYIAYFAEALPGGRGQMICDIVIDGRLEQTYPVGSPARMETLRRYEHTTSLAPSRGREDDAPEVTP